MSLADELAEYVAACFSGVWIETVEPDEATREIAALCRNNAWRLAQWNLETGLSAGGQTEGAVGADLLAAVRAASGLAAGEGAGILLLENFHRFLGSPEVVQAIARQIQLGKRQRTFIVILAPLVELPLELEKLFVILEHKLPGRDELRSIAQELLREDDVVTSPELSAAVEAAAGLTRYEAEGAFSLSIVREGRLSPRTIWGVKSQQLKKTSLLSLHGGTERFGDLGGLAGVKAFCLRALRATGRAQCRARGVLLLSPPGCGKSDFCKALGNEVGRPTLRLDLGSLMGSLVGETERNLRRALATAEAMAPCVLFCDELDKGLAGAAAGGAGDAGVSARMFGSLLTWLADRTSDVFVVATANSIDRLPTELTRAERFDGIFFMDLPEKPERRAIWEIHRRRHELDLEQPLPNDDCWTGAEIAACCRLSALLDLPLAAAAEHIVPIAVSGAESIEQLRSWASRRCLAAETGRVYERRGGATGRRRRLGADPSAN